MTSLFDDSIRTDDGPSRYAEPHYSYLNRSARTEAGCIRTLIDDWFSEYPAYHRKEFRSRLAAKHDHDFDAAFFELYLHHLFRHAGAALRVHPRIGKRTRRPDFRVTLPSGERFLLEAVTVSWESAEQRRGKARLQVVYDSLNKAKSPDFFFRVQNFGLPRSSVPGRQFRETLERWIGTLDYDSLRETLQDQPLSGPSLEFEHDGCTLVISVVPVSQVNRGAAGHRPVGIMGGSGAQPVDYWTPIRDAITRKANYYGQFRQPYLIGVNARDQFAAQIDVMQALFGQEAFVFPQNSDEAVMQRLPNGAWWGKRGRPINTLLSGVLVVGGLEPWTVAVQRPVLYFNPWASRPLPDVFTRFDRRIPMDRKMIAAEGLPMEAVMRLPHCWPAALRPA